MLRVTQNMLSNTMLYDLNNSMDSLAKYQNMLATGLKVAKPSDDPVLAAKGMDYRTLLAQNDQYQKNTGTASKWLDASDSAINEANNVMMRVKDLVTQASNDTLNQSDRKAIHDELIQLREQLGSIANTKIGDQYLFAGTNVDNAPYGQKPADQLQQTVDNNIIDPNTLPYASENGYTNQNGSAFTLEVSPSVQIPVNIDATKLFGQQLSSPPAGQEWKTDLFATMDKIISDLQPPSPYKSNDKGQLLAAYATDNPPNKAGDPITDTTTNEPVLYDPNDATQTPLKKTDDEVKPKTGADLSGYLGVIQGHINNFLQIQADVGARSNRIQLIQSRLDTQNTQTQTFMSDDEDADPAKVITDLQNQENVHRAALAVGSRIIQTSLLDFLH